MSAPALFHYSQFTVGHLHCAALAANSVFFPHSLNIPTQGKGIIASPRSLLRCGYSHLSIDRIGYCQTDPVMKNTFNTIPSNRALRRKNHGKRISTWVLRSEEHTSELQSIMSISYAVFCLKKKNISHIN